MVSRPGKVCGSAASHPLRSWRGAAHHSPHPKAALSSCCSPRRCAVRRAPTPPLARTPALPPRAPAPPQPGHAQVAGPAHPRRAAHAPSRQQHQRQGPTSARHAPPPARRVAWRRVVLLLPRTAPDARGRRRPRLRHVPRRRHLGRAAAVAARIRRAVRAAGVGARRRGPVGGAAQPAAPQEAPRRRRHCGGR